MDEGHLCVSTRLLGLPAEEQSAGCSGLLPPPQSCRYSLVAPTLAPPTLLSMCLLSLYTHTRTHKICTVILWLFLTSALLTEWAEHCWGRRHGCCQGTQTRTSTRSRMQRHLNVTQRSCIFTANTWEWLWHIGQHSLALVLFFSTKASSGRHLLRETCVTVLLIYLFCNCTDGPPRALAGCVRSCVCDRAADRLPCMVMSLDQYNTAKVLRIGRVLVCPVNCITQRRIHASACAHRLTKEKHWESSSQLFPASWPASLLYCPALKRDPVSICRLLISSRVAEDKQMFPLPLAFFSPPYFFSRGKDTEEYFVVLSYSSEQCSMQVR